MEKGARDEMITPRDFYPPEGKLKRSERTSVWKGVRTTLQPSARLMWTAIERRSFILGVAATFVMLFAAVGIYTTAQNLLEKTRPTAIRIDHAYEAAINQFEDVVVERNDNRDFAPPVRELAAARQRQLDFLDTAIHELRLDMNGHDISPLIRSRLRELYSKKLALLQVMVAQGDIAL